MIDAEATAVAVLTAYGIPAGVELAEDTPRYFVRVAAAGGPPARSGMPDRLVTVDLQFDCWAPSKAEAADLAGLVGAAMLAAPRNPATYDPPAVVTSTTVTAPTWIPDPDWPLDGRPGPRYVVLGSLTAHP